jgi:DNA-binding SARP family transcriptional activator
MFGETRVIDGDRIVGPRDFGGVKPRQVLEVLALHAGHPVTKETLIDSLWGERAPGSSTATLEAYVSVLRRRIEPNVRPCASLVHTINGGYLLDPCEVRIDLHEFHQLLARPTQDVTAPPAQRLATALALAEDDLLESEPYAPWAVQARELVHSDIVTACEVASVQAMAIGEWSEAIALARRALTLDPLAETCGRSLVEALWRDGRRAEALRAYEALRRALADELGTDPDASTQALHLSVLRSACMEEDHRAVSNGPEVSNSHDAPIADEVLLERLVGDVVRTVGGLRSSRQIFIDSLMTRIAAELVAS